MSHTRTEPTAADSDDEEDEAVMTDGEEISSKSSQQEEPPNSEEGEDMMDVDEENRHEEVYEKKMKQRSRFVDDGADEASEDDDDDDDGDDEQGAHVDDEQGNDDDESSEGEAAEEGGGGGEVAVELEEGGEALAAADDAPMEQDADDMHDAGSPAAPPPPVRVAPRARIVARETGAMADGQPQPDDEAADLDTSMQNAKVAKCEVTQGICVMEGTEVLDDRHLFGPLFCIPFYMSDKTGLSPLMHDALWVLHNVQSCVEKGETGSHMRIDTGSVRTIGGDPGPPAERFVVVSNRGGGAGRTLVPDMVTSLRIHEAKHPGLPSEFYVLMVVRYPLPFSLRHAVYTTMQTKGRGEDARDADPRREVWNRLAMHVRCGTGGSLRDEMAHGGLASNSVEWMRVPNRHSFTTLFSVPTAAEWVRRHYFSTHPRRAVASFELEGFGEMRRSAPVAEWEDSEFVRSFERYDDHTNEAIRRTYERKTKRPRQQQQQGGEPEPQEAEIEPPRAPVGVTLLDGNTGLPACELAMRVSVPSMVEAGARKALFTAMVKPFPTGVSVGILQRSMGVQLGAELAALMMGDDVLDGNECLLAMHGRQQTMTRPMLANGDTQWAAGCRAGVQALCGDRIKERPVMALRMVRVAFSLALTRSMGSDIYVHPLAQSYGQYMERHAEPGRPGPTTAGDCRAAYESLLQGRGKDRAVGCTHHAGLLGIGDIVSDCNCKGWKLRPDNLQLVLHMMVSHVMLCLNFYGSGIEGATNGIGATLLIRNGAGSFRHTSKEGTDLTGMQQDYGKVNGSGADMAMNIMIQSTTPGTHDRRHRMTEDYMVELKRTSELGLMMETCNIYEGMGVERHLKHAARMAHKRMYSTELRCANEPSCTTTMHAIVNIVPRNTTSENTNSQRTTREHERTKERIPVEYQVVTNGFFVMASNFVAPGMIKERMKTISNVVRNVPSCADAMPDEIGGEDDPEGRAIELSNGRVDHSSSAHSAMSEGVLAAGRPLMWTALGVAVYTGFMQWTGMLGRLPACEVTEELTATFYSQLDLSADLLNQDMHGSGEFGRSKQISKARAVAMSLLGSAMQSVGESGRIGEGQRDAVERCASELTMRCMGPSVMPWLIADTVDHMLRMDFVIVMQLIASTLGVPADIQLGDVLSMLRGGARQIRPSLNAWMNAQTYMRGSAIDRRTGLGDLACSQFVISTLLQSRLADGTQGSVEDMDRQVFLRVGAELFSKNRDVLGRFCQVNTSNLGEDIVRNMLRECSNRNFRWPAVFGSCLAELPNFWMGQGTSHGGDTNKLLCAPLRVVQSEHSLGSLCVDVRWLLLISSICKPKPSQASRLLLVSAWTRYFYQSCVPDSMVPAEGLFVGLPSPYMMDGFMTPRPRPSGRKLLRRPRGEKPSQTAPCATGLVEDMGPAAPRLQLARALKMEEKDLPTDSVNYSFPPGVWVPVEVTLSAEQRERLMFEEEADVPQFGGLRLNRGGTGFMLAIGTNRVQADADGDAAAASFLEGRLAYDVRPMCLFDRPGLLLPTVDGLGLLLPYDLDRGVFPVILVDGNECIASPQDVNDAAMPLGGELYLKVDAIEAHPRYTFLRTRGSPVLGVDAKGRYIRCSLRAPDDYTGREASGMGVPISILKEPGGGRNERRGGASATSQLCLNVSLTMLLTRRPEDAFDTLMCSLGYADDDDEGSDNDGGGEAMPPIDGDGDDRGRGGRLSRGA